MIAPAKGGNAMAVPSRAIPIAPTNIAQRSPPEAAIKFFSAGPNINNAIASAITAYNIDFSKSKPTKSVAYHT